MKETLLRVVAEIRSAKNVLHHISVLVAAGVPLAKIFRLLDNTDWHHVFIIGTLGLLMAKSIQNEWLFSRIQPKLSGNPIRVHPLWSSDSVRQALRASRKSIVVFQTWVPDATEMGDLIRELGVVHSDAAPFDLEVNMLSPENLSGAYRVHQLERELSSFDAVQAQERHREHFRRACDALVVRLSGCQGVRLRIYTYDSLPALKLYILDEQDYLFSWFGADRPSTQNVCIQVSKRSGSAEVDRLIQRLQDHREAVEKRRRLAWPVPPVENAGASEGGA